ncbi:hypothetical protein SMKI_04G4080 [Saccharomyces mikatae IFO 1815]|uniref:Nup42p n=1 Tax=Saccharomyces mikatae IFO 1815 TaxID=226126 RepID=A0AA35IW83_SACMI|nr:uncharacterized protein SMKI_04G4080 [Saccharomyces mikatae IFO 1815]CAI4038068.1 hypothetical protein SMKI_04G4080 [Saccharomyces mikatae IFO 1815]
MSAFANPFTSSVKPGLSNTNGANPFTTNGASNTGMGSNVFGRPSFGATSSMTGGATASAFGQPQFGANTNNTGNAPISAFGNTNNVIKPSAFGAPAFGSSAPVNINTPATSSAFGAPSFGSTSFGNTAAMGNPFSKAPSSMGSAFGQTGFGANGTDTTSSSTNHSNNSAFGTTQNVPLTASSPFGSLQQNSSQNASATSSVFGKPAFGTAGNTQSPFSAIQNSSTTTGTGASPFGSFGTNNSNKSPFGDLQNGAAVGTSPFGLTNSKTNNNNESSPFGATDNQASIKQSAFGQGTSGSFVSAPSNPDMNTNTNFQSAFGNKGFSFGIAPQKDTNKVSTTSSTFGQIPNTNIENNSGRSPFGFGQQPMSINTASCKTRFVQGIPSEKDGFLELADLAEETLKIFEANKFELGLVPDVPPPPALVA